MKNPFLNPDKIELTKVSTGTEWSAHINNFISKTFVGDDDRAEDFMLGINQEEKKIIIGFAKGSESIIFSLEYNLELFEAVVDSLPVLRGVAHDPKLTKDVLITFFEGVDELHDMSHAQMGQSGGSMAEMLIQAITGRNLSARNSKESNAEEQIEKDKLLCASFHALSMITQSRVGEIIMAENRWMFLPSYSDERIKEPIKYLISLN